MSKSTDFPSIDETKKEARQISKEKKVKLNHALNMIAERYGYYCWRDLKVAIEASPVVELSDIRLAISISNPSGGAVNMSDIAAAPAMRMDDGWHLRPSLVIKAENKKTGDDLGKATIGPDAMKDAINAGEQFPFFEIVLRGGLVINRDNGDMLLFECRAPLAMRKYVEAYNKKVNKGQGKTKDELSIQRRCSECDELFPTEEAMIKHHIRLHNGMASMRERHASHCVKGGKCTCRIAEYERVFEKVRALDKISVFSSNSLFDKACAHFGTLKHENPPCPIPGMSDVAWKLLMEPEWIACDKALVPSDNGSIGIVEQGVKGVTPTAAKAASYGEAEEACRWFNQNILGEDEVNVARIACGSMD